MTSRDDRNSGSDRHAGGEISPNDSQQTAADAGASSTATVFIVDDEDSVRRAVSLMLETAGFRVQTFASANDFLEAYRSTAGCLLLDVRMPGMDGMQLLRNLSKQQVEIPVIMLSAHGDIPMAVDALQTGAFDFLEKPVRPSVLREKIRLALGRDARNRAEAEMKAEILICYASLTPREKEVLEFVIDGKRPAAIAKVLGTSENTIRVQRFRILKKMKADGATDLLKLMKHVRRDL